jgi:hypothetical protein
MKKTIPREALWGVLGLLVAAITRRPCNRAPHDVFDVAAADADIAQFTVGELGQFAHRLAIPTPSAELRRNRLEGFHIHSFPGGRSRLLHCEMVTSNHDEYSAVRASDMRSSHASFWREETNPLKYLMMCPFYLRPLEYLSREIDC